MFFQKREFKNSKGFQLSAVYEGQDQNVPVVVMCHGYGSSKDSVSNADLAKKLTSAGISVFRFDFTGSGQSGGNLVDCTPTQGLDDLKFAIKDMSKEKFALHGTSFGGYVALTYAIHNPILALSLKAPVSDYVEVLKLKGGEKEARAADFARQAYQINIYKDAPNIKIPVLIIHGGNDKDVPLAQSERLLKCFRGEKTLSILHDADHRMLGFNMEVANNQITEFFVNKLL